MWGGGTEGYSDIWGGRGLGVGKATLITLIDAVGKCEVLKSGRLAAIIIMYGMNNERGIRIGIEFYKQVGNLENQKGGDKVGKSEIVIHMGTVED